MKRMGEWVYGKSNLPISITRYRNARQVCPRCNHGWTGDIPLSVMRLKKVFFTSYRTYG